MRISDWSSDVCSSDLDADLDDGLGHRGDAAIRVLARVGDRDGLPGVGRDGVRHGWCRGDEVEPELAFEALRDDLQVEEPEETGPEAEIGRASCRERVCQYV